MILTAFDAAGAPLADLAPTWAACLVASTGAAASQPAVADVGGGLYALALPEGVAGILDFGATALPRYVAVANADETVLAAYDADGGPLDGLAPTWASWRVAATGADATPGPTVTELSGGLYRVESPPDGEVGVLDLGATASPRHLGIGDELTGGGGGDPVAPTVENITPAAGSPISSGTTLGFDVVDNVALRRVVVLARFVGGAQDVVHDGDAFAATYARGSTRTAIAGGWRYRIRRVGGWPSSPSILPLAVDTSGNEAP